MHNAALVEVRDAKDELAEDAPRLAHRETPLLDQVVEELAAGTQLGDEVDGRLSRDDFVQREDVRVPESAVVVDLAREERERRGWVRRLRMHRVKRYQGKRTCNHARTGRFLALA